MPLPQFIESRPLDRIAYGSVGGPVSRTTVIRTAGGQEQRNNEWGDNPLRRYDLSSPLGDGDDLDALLSAVIVTRGRTVPFRFKDRWDYRATSQSIDVSGGGPVYQLRRAYTLGAETVYRSVYKIVSGTVTVLLNGSPVTITAVASASGANDLWNQPLWGDSIVGASGVTLDFNSGVLRWYTEPYPTTGDTLVWTGEYDVPVRFDMDYPQFEATNYESYTLRSFPITEVRDF